MDLLPKTKSEFSDKEYWNKFFQKRGKDAFEWYGEYTQLCGILHKYMKRNDQILGIGCGNSRLGIELYDVGQYVNNVNIDISELSIKSMNQLHTKNRPGLQFIHMDMLQMSFDDATFNVVLDKGTLDALMSDSSQTTDENADKMFSEIERVLKLGGRYICISLLQEHIIRKILSWFPTRGWFLRIHRCQEAEQQSGSSNLVFPVFVVVVTKMKPLPGIPPVMELCLAQEGTIQRVTSTDEIISGLAALQHYAIVRHKLAASTVVDNRVRVELHVKDEANPRYVLYVVDRSGKNARMKFAIFIVPQGRECEWMFGNENGQKLLADKASCHRLVVVHLSRDHQYESLDAIKIELSSKVIELSPSKLPANYQIPFLSVGDDIGHRQICDRGETPNSGKYVIEEVESDGGVHFRRLIFLTSQNVVQSEARLKSVIKRGKKGKKNERKVVDLNHLTYNHLKYMVASLSFLEKCNYKGTDEIKLLLIGLGSGSLAMFLHHNFPNVKLDVVEIDENIVEIAKKWFDYRVDARNTIHVDDGLNFVERQHANGEQYDIVMFDVDNKDTSLGLSCPPQSFLSNDVLKKSFELLQDNGLLVVNLVCRAEDLKCKTLKDMKTVFPSIFVTEVENDVNDVVFCLKGKCETAEGVLGRARKELENVNKRLANKLENEDLIDITSLMQTIKII